MEQRGCLRDIGRKRFRGNGQTREDWSLRQHFTTPGLNVEPGSHICEPFTEQMRVSPRWSFLGRTPFKPREVPAVNAHCVGLCNQVVERCAHHVSISCRNRNFRELLEARSDRKRNLHWTVFVINQIQDSGGGFRLFLQDGRAMFLANG
jgi:hypothetical protein